MINFRQVIDFIYKPYVACIFLFIGFSFFILCFYGTVFSKIGIILSYFQLFCIFIFISLAFFFISLFSISKRERWVGGILYISYFLLICSVSTNNVEVIRLAVSLKIAFQSKKYEDCAARATPIDGSHVFAVCDWREINGGEFAVAIVYDSSGLIAKDLDKKEYKFMLMRIGSSIGLYFDDFRAVRAFGDSNFYRVQLW